MTSHGFPAIFAGSHVYVSVNRFLDHADCLSENLLPAGLVSKTLTGASFSRKFLYLLFGQQVLRVRVSQLISWLAGDLSERVLDVKSFPDGVPPVSRLVTTPCCDDTKWCENTNRHLVGYSLKVRNSTVMLLTSLDHGDSYHRQPVSVPADSEPLLFAQYPSEAYGTLFFNHEGRGMVARIMHRCHSLPRGTAEGQRNGPGCQRAALQVTDKPVRVITVQPTMRMLTILVTEDFRLFVSGRADTHFEQASVLDAASLAVVEGTSQAHLPLRAFTTDGERWMLIDADGHMLLGSALNVWTARVIRLQSKNILSAPLPASPPAPAESSTENSASSLDDRFGSIISVAATGPYPVFLLRGRTVEVLTLTVPPDGRGMLACSLRRVSLWRHLAPLDAQCGVLRLTAVSRSHLEPMVDKSDTLRLDVRLTASGRLSVRPLVLFSSSALVSNTRLVASRAQPDGTVTSQWLVTVRSHPQLRQRPFLRQLQLAQLHVTSTEQQPECPARLPHPFPVLVGCNPWLKLVARNKRVDEETCRHLQAAGLTVESSPERDPLLRYQQQVRGEHAVRLVDGQWRVSWDPAWGCPLLSSDKAQFTPVLAVKSGDQLRPLRQITSLYEIHGLQDFGFDLTASAASCRHHEYGESLSWRRSYAELWKQRGNLSGDFDPTAVLNTASYVSCNDSHRLSRHFSPDPDLAAQSAENVSFELFGLPGRDNSIIWADSAKIHVFNFRVIDPLFTFCDLNLTVPVFFMHSSDVKQKTKLTILLVGVGMSLLAVLLAHASQQVMRRLRLEKQQQLDVLLTAADAFVEATGPRQPPHIQGLPPIDLARLSKHK
ncbi:Cation channel sperm-associated protein subunit delta [Amphibalanus amphitrite]|uniref:Cation channel sperm-associated protein subunit delta n=1 Tax=Amphibalanus amphitrite TaxID=1232801 RepID=A0A6A4VHG8_AMPAM|nr:Cation channel sperm-associated protein subunit delta [Amphibalanus amphitrite]